MVPLKTTNGIFIGFAGALILLIEGLFVCLLSAVGSNRNHMADWISAVVCLEVDKEMDRKQHEKCLCVRQTVNRFVGLSSCFPYHNLPI